MIPASADNLVLETRNADVLYLTLNRPLRGNSLVPALLDQFLSALDRHDDARSIVLKGAGKAFSTGGDIGAFLDQSDDPDALFAYSSGLVGKLNQLILALIDRRALMITHLNGPLTGGSLGLMLAADHVLVDANAFIQPYYAPMGFAPDGGWTAILPRQIGAHQARNWITRDARWSADQLCTAGLAQERVTATSAAARIAAILDESAELDREVMRLVRQQTLGDGLATRLEDERRAFLDRILQPEAKRRMKRFTDSSSRQTSGAA